MEKVLTTQFSFFIVGAGGFGGKRSSDQIIPIVDPPNRKPDAFLQYKTSFDQVVNSAYFLNFKQVKLYHSNKRTCNHFFNFFYFTSQRPQCTA